MNEQLIQNFKKKLLAGKPVFGPFMKTCDPGFVESKSPKYPQQRRHVWP
ncbi:MAG: hypothetical protein HFH24_05805 [Ruminococcus sp.]|nr:hypothetical protein [Ruminococcus sp.]